MSLIADSLRVMDQKNRNDISNDIITVFTYQVMNEYVIIGSAASVSKRYSHLHR